VLLDAMAHGKAVIVSDVGGSRDYVTHGEDALVVPPGCVVSLDKAMRELVNDPQRAAQLGKAAMRRAAMLTPEAFWSSVLSS
jgi:glycosyltransferase involved in cell wall biosynthesis